MLDSGNAKTQDKWAEYTMQARPKGDFYTGDMPLYHAVFTALFKQKDKKESEEARAFIQKQMREKYPMTLTKIIYQPTGKDKIIHNFGTNDKYELEEDIVGKDRAIGAGDKKTLNAVLGVEDIDEIKSVYNWINQTPTWIWRVNKNPENIDERVARFGAYSDRVGLNCNWDPANSDASLGVRIAQKI